MTNFPNLRVPTILIAEDDDGHAKLIIRNLPRSGLNNKIIRAANLSARTQLQNLIIDPDQRVLNRREFTQLTIRRRGREQPCQLSMNIAGQACQHDSKHE